MSISVAIVLGCGLGTGCSDDCGFGDAPLSGLVVSGTGVTLTYGNLTALAGNDCPVVPPDQVVSISIEGTLTDGTGLINLCIPRPDLLTTPDRTIGAGTSTADIRLLDIHAAADNCTFTRDPAKPPAGTGVGVGVCGDGVDPAGFALSLDGTLALKKTCGIDVTSVDVTITGKVAVKKRP